MPAKIKDIYDADGNELVDLPKVRPGVMLFLDFNEIVKEISQPSLVIMSMIISYVRDKTNIIAYDNGKPIGIEEMVVLCNKSKVTIINAIKELEKKQIICKVRNKHRITLYVNPYMVSREININKDTLELFKDYSPKEPIVVKMAFIYFILNKDLNSVKIGYTTDIFNRLNALQTSNSSSLILLGKIKGSFELETYIHKMLKLYRIRGEWYQYSKEVEQYVNNLLERKV